MTPQERAAWGQRPTTAPSEIVWQTGSIDRTLGALQALGKTGIAMQSLPVAMPVVMTIASADPTAYPYANAPSTTAGSFAFVLEYGSGAESNEVFFDLAPGSYQLPAVRFARLSVLGGTGAAVPLTGRRIQYSCSFAAGSAVNVDVPFLTTLPGGSIPARAVAVELIAPGRLVIDGGQQIVESDWLAATPVFGPPYSPVRVRGSSFVFTVNGAWTGSRYVRWLLSL